MRARRNRMLKKAKAGLEASGNGDDGSSLSQSVLKSSHQIWLAGLGAFAKAQTGGVKVFETLVKQGASLETKTRQAAAATADAAREAAMSKAKEMHAMAGGTWDKLEQVFQERVARALGQLGVYTSSDVERLTARVNELSEAVNALLKAQGVKRSPPSTVEKKGKRGLKSATGAAKTVSKAGKTAKKTVKARAKQVKTAVK
jgi:poly(hydroxyalkanoate) granule-associated protein